MSTIVTRAGKGSPLTYTEADANFTNLNTDKYESGDSPTFTAVTITSSQTLGGVPTYGYGNLAAATYIIGINTTPVQWDSLGTSYGYSLNSKAFWVQSGSTTYFMHGARINSAGNYVYTTTGVTPIWCVWSGGQALFQGAASGTAGNTISPNSTLQIDCNNNLVNLLCGKLAFPATQSASADANTLDDYEEGTWTPGIAFGGGTTGLTYTAQNGAYTKIGNRVILTGQVTVNAKGSSTGAVTITGFPFTASASNARGGGGASYYGGTTLTSGGLAFVISASATTASLFQEGTGSTSAIADTHVSAGFDLYFTLSYHI